MGLGGPFKPIAIATAILCGSAAETEGFAPTIPQRSHHHNDVVSLSQSAPSPTALPALVYGADGSVVKDEDFVNPDDNNDDVGKTDKGDDALLEALKSSVGNPSVWNTIACAFAAPPHNELTPELVKDAVPVGVSLVDGSGGIDIAVAVPASVGVASTAAANQLVRVLVHARFPQAWAMDADAGHEGTVATLVRQVSILEGLARDRLSERSERDEPGYYEKKVIDARWNERLSEEPSSGGEIDIVGLPAWWTPIAPLLSSLELVDEAKLLKKLLNEDEFEDELRALFVRHGNDSGDDDDDDTDPFVVRAAVASVGSTGLLLKARVLRAEDSSKPPSGDEATRAETVASVAITYGNPPNEVETAGDLREGVLTLVESVDPMPMPTRPQAAEAPPDSEAEPFTPFNEQVVELISQRAASADDDAVVTAADVPEPDREDEEPTEVRSNQQPRPPDEEARLAAKYAAIEDLGERAFTILRDLGMV